MILNGFIPESSLINSMDGAKFTLNEKKQGDSSSDSVSFMDTLKSKLNDLNDQQVNAEETTSQFVAGKDVSVDQVMLSTEESKMSMELAVQVRNKLVEAYQELNRMQL